MKKKIVLSFLVMALMMALVGGATFALFTDKAENLNNTFAAGTIDISATDSANEWTLGCDKMAPGDEKTATITVKNEGNLELRYDIAAVISGDLFTNQGNGNQAFVSYKLDGNDYAVTGDDNLVLAPGASNVFVVTVKLPKEAGNEFQGDQGVVSLTFNAEQTANN